VAALTQVEAVERAASLEVRSYTVDLDLGAARTDSTFSSSSTISFCATGSSTWVDVHAEHLVEVRLDGEPLETVGWADGRLPLRGLGGEHVLVVRAVHAYSRTGEGLHRYVDPEDGQVYLYSQTFLDDAPKVMACFDQPDLKARFGLTVTAPEGWTVLGNGAGEQTASGTWQFAVTQPLPTYLFALVAGPYHGVTGSHDGIDLGVWCRASWASALDAPRLLRTTAQGLDTMHRLFGVRYPFGKYDQVFVPEFNAGAMENAGLVTFRDEAYLQRGTTTETDAAEVANTQLHELAHMWFGDLVSMRWWDDLWLNESFADYLGYRIQAEGTERADAWTSFLVRRKTWGYEADQRSTTHPVAGTASDTATALLNFDGISYAKGASSLRQLVEFVGDDAFLLALRDHFRAHAFGNATLEDLVGALTRASGRDVATWVRQWLRTSGPSTLGVRFEVDHDDRWTRVEVTQQAVEDLRPHRISLGAYDVVDERGRVRLVRRTAVAVDVTASASTPVPELVGEPAADLLLPNDGDLTFALLDLDDRSLTTALAHLRHLDDVQARCLVWVTLDTMVGQGRLAPSAFAGLVTTSVRDDDPEALLVWLLTRADRAARVWALPDAQAGLAEALTDWALAGALAAEPGSDRQLTLTRAVARSGSDPDLLRGWLSGRGRPAGLVVDADLRWRLVHRLSALGACTAGEVADERRRDPSSRGGQHALTAAAARPDVAAKRTAWNALVAGTLSNHDAVATGRGLDQPGQADLLAPYVDDFVRDFPAVAAAQSPQLVQSFAQLAFPSTVVEPGALVALQRLLDSGGLDAPATRLVTERRDDLASALRARAADSDAARAQLAPSAE
jgi:aminopeptidase N